MGITLTFLLCCITRSSAVFAVLVVLWRIILLAVLGRWNAIILRCHRVNRIYHFASKLELSTPADRSPWTLQPMRQFFSSTALIRDRILRSPNKKYVQTINFTTKRTAIRLISGFWEMYEDLPSLAGFFILN